MRPAFLAAGLLALFASASGARELTTAEKRVIPYGAELPLCGDPAVLANVATGFAEKEAQFWNSRLTILTYDAIKPVAFRPWGLDTIPRRFCTATSTLSDGRRTRVDFSVREDLDFIGTGWSVEFCVVGTDRSSAYSPACRMARP